MRRVLERLLELRCGSQERDDLLVRARRRVAERRAATDVELDGERPRPHDREPLRPEHVPAPRAAVLRAPLRDVPVSVAAHEPDSVAQRAEQIEALGGHRAGHEVASAHERVGAVQPGVGEDRPEGWQVAVYVVEGRDRHGTRLDDRGSGIACVGACPGCPEGVRIDARAGRTDRRARDHTSSCPAQPIAASSGAAVPGGDPPSRGPAHTTSSAGQPAHAKGLGVGRNSPARMRAIDADRAASSRGASAA